MQTVSVVATVTTLCMILKPPAAQAQSLGRVAPPLPRAPVNVVRSADEQYAQALARLEELVKAARAQRSRGAAASRASDAQGLHQAIRETIQRLQTLDAAEDESFAAITRLLEERKLATEIKERHRSAERAFKQKRQAMKHILEKLEAADATADDVARAKRLQELDAFLALHQAGKHHEKLDPNKLPWRVLDSKVRKPAQSIETFRASAVPSSSSSATPSTSATLAAQTALAPSSPDYLAETDDAQLTQPVRDLAASLGGNPVRIYNWVRNNIEYFPTFGSIQGSDVTLSKRRGNAFDTASLLIALYRASSIPARYAYGTIEVPVAAAMNWVGGVSTPEAAQQLWGQGGVPNAALMSGGRITHIQLEHVWVEAWLDFVPSRGQIHAQGDTWVPLDASYKQYTETAGLASEANIRSTRARSSRPS